MEKEKEFWVECNVCKTQYKNHVGSTPCCGSIAYLMEGETKTKSLVLFASVNGDSIRPTIIKTQK